MKLGQWLHELLAQAGAVVVVVASDAAVVAATAAVTGNKLVSKYHPHLWGWFCFTWPLQSERPVLS